MEEEGLNSSKQKEQRIKDEWVNFSDIVAMFAPGNIEH
jgi:hypothetical protein